MSENGTPVFDSLGMRTQGAFAASQIVLDPERGNPYFVCADVLFRAASSFRSIEAIQSVTKESSLTITMMLSGVTLCGERRNRWSDAAAGHDSGYSYETPRRWPEMALPALDGVGVAPTHRGRFSDSSWGNSARFAITIH